MDEPSSSQELCQATTRSLNDPVQVKATSRKIQEQKKLTTIVEAAAQLGAERVG